MVYQSTTTFRIMMKIQLEISPTLYGPIQGNIWEMSLVEARGLVSIWVGNRSPVPII